MDLVEYELEPFYASVACRRRRAAIGQHPLHHIPGAKIPSPLADNLDPLLIKRTHDYLLGLGKYGLKGKDRYEGGNGREVWESWKRAWDIWNNHYIEGRVNSLWVKAKYGKYKEWLEREPEVESPVEFSRMRTLEITEQQAIAENAANAADRERLRKLFGAYKRLGPGYVDFSVALFQQSRQAESMPIWDDYKGQVDSDIDAVQIALLQEVGKTAVDGFLQLVHIHKSNGAGHVNFCASLSRWSSGPGKGYESLPLQWETFQRKFELIKAEPPPSILYSDFPSDAAALNDVSKEPQTIIERVKSDLCNPAIVNLGTGYRRFVVDFAKWATYNKLVPEKDMKPPPDDEDYQFDRLNAEIAAYFSTGRPLVAREVLEEATDWIREPVPARFKSKNSASKPSFVEDDGASGGFYSMKSLVPDYPLGCKGRPPGGHMPLDKIENTVWRPRWVGEVDLRIDMDEDFGSRGTYTMAIDGGVDCGRSPYPVLRPVTEYMIEHESNTKPSCASGPFKKVKDWDYASSTVFNMPTKPIETLNENYVPDDPAREFAFPLDIRRVRVLDPRVRTKFATSAWGYPKGTIIRTHANTTNGEQRTSDEEDPWFVTPEQRVIREVPSREQPLPLDDEHKQGVPIHAGRWEEQVDFDIDLATRYFATNLDGRKLTINGVKVELGEIAGPLPDFAVIETEGGQVSFWWGVNGRQFGAKKSWSAFIDEYRIVRSLPGWEHFGKVAGEVWEEKILHRIKTADDNDEENEDDPWVRWMKATARVEEHTSNTLLPSWVQTRDDELKWIALKCHEIHSGRGAIQPGPIASVSSALEGPAFGGFDTCTRAQKRFVEIAKGQDEEWWEANKSAITAATDALFARFRESLQAKKLEIAEELLQQKEEILRRETATDTAIHPDTKNKRKGSDNFASPKRKLRSEDAQVERAAKIANVQRLMEETDARGNYDVEENQRQRRAAFEKYTVEKARREEENETLRLRGGVRLLRPQAVACPLLPTRKEVEAWYDREEAWRQEDRAIRVYNNTLPGSVQVSPQYFKEAVEEQRPSKRRKTVALEGDLTDTRKPSSGVPKPSSSGAQNSADARKKAKHPQVILSNQDRLSASHDEDNTPTSKPDFKFREALAVQVTTKAERMAKRKYLEAKVGSLKRSEAAAMKELARLVHAPGLFSPLNKTTVTAAARAKMKSAAAHLTGERKLKSFRDSVSSDPGEAAPRSDIEETQELTATSPRITLKRKPSTDLRDHDEALSGEEDPTPSNSPQLSPWKLNPTCPPSKDPPTMSDKIAKQLRGLQRQQKDLVIRIKKIEENGTDLEGSKHIKYKRNLFNCNLRIDALEELRNGNELKITDAEPPSNRVTAGYKQRMRHTEAYPGREARNITPYVDWLERLANLPSLEEDNGGAGGGD